MSQYKPPWWLPMSKSVGLVTTIQEETKPGVRTFIVRGEPTTQGLAWLTWGPAAAVVAVLVITVFAITLDVREQSGAMRALFIGLFLIVPAVSWWIVMTVFSRISQRHVDAARSADAKICSIQLHQDEGILRYQTTQPVTKEQVSFRHIQQAKLEAPVGERDSKKVKLTLETHQGPIVLLNEALGTRTQKLDLANIIQEAIDRHKADQADDD